MSSIVSLTLLAGRGHRQSQVFGLLLLPFSFIFLCYLTAWGLSCSTQDLCCVTWDLSLRHMECLNVAMLLRGMWDLSSLTRNQTCMSPALQGRCLTTGPAGKSLLFPPDVLSLKSHCCQQNSARCSLPLTPKTLPLVQTHTHHFQPHNCDG